MLFTVDVLVEFELAEILNNVLPIRLTNDVAFTEFV